MCVCLCLCIRVSVCGSRSLLCRRYVFEGLGHLVASILINSTQFLKRINENGIKKM